ncbi:MAG: hypothetical protein P1U63_05670 [Coxiellaceae bacterium]|nr:hypothetical protein [Coxiellaceae bacterium]
MSRPDYSTELIATLRAVDLNTCARTLARMMHQSMVDLDTAKMGFASTELFKLFVGEAASLSENTQIELFKESLFGIKGCPAQLALLVQGALLPAMEMESEVLKNEILNVIAATFLTGLVATDLTAGLQLVLANIHSSKKDFPVAVKAELVGLSAAAKRLVFVSAVVNKRFDVVDEVLLASRPVDADMVDMALKLLLVIENPVTKKEWCSYDDFTALLGRVDEHIFSRDDSTKQHLHHVLAVMIAYRDPAVKSIKQWVAKHDLFTGKFSTDSLTENQLSSLLKHACDHSNLHVFVHLFPKYQAALEGGVRDVKAAVALTMSSCLQAAYDADDKPMVKLMVQRFSSSVNDAVLEHLGHSQQETPSELYTLVNHAKSQLRPRQDSVLKPLVATLAAQSVARSMAKGFRARRRGGVRAPVLESVVEAKEHKCST